MTSLAEDFPALWHFFGAYLHQDWQDEYDSTGAAFRDFLDGEPRYGALVAGELKAVLSSARDEPVLDELVRGCGSFYIPSMHGIATSTWLADLLAMSAETVEDFVGREYESSARDESQLPGRERFHAPARRSTSLPTLVTRRRRGRRRAN